MKTKYRPIMSARSGHNGNKTLTNTVHRKLFALGLPGILFIAVCALLPSPAQAQCHHWNVTGLWELRGDNEINLLANLQQGAWQGNSANLTGTGERELSAKGAQGAKLSGINSGKISGTISENSFVMEVTYPSFTSRYTGKINTSTGKMEGTNDTGAHWVSGKTFSCALTAPAAPDTKAAADAWINQELSKRKTATQPTPSPRPRGFINGLQLGTPTPTPSAEADESSSDDQHKKNKK